MVIVPTHERVLKHIVPQAHGHVVGAGHHEALSVRREPDLPDRVAVAAEHRDGDPVAPDVPDLDGLVHGGSRDAAIVVLVPVAGEDLEVVGGDDHSGAGLAHVPDAESAIAGGGGEDVGVAGVPYGGVDAVGVLLEGADGGGAVEGPELDGVIPGGGEEGIAADGIVVGRVGLAGVLEKGADGVGGGGEGEVVDFDRAVGDGSH